jgi:putative NADH-flavin reductase
MSTIAVLGGSGRTGRPLVEELLQRGHSVRALARTPSALAERPGMIVLPGSSTDPASLDALLSGSDAVLSALGPRKDEPHLQSTTARLLVQFMFIHGTARFIGVSGAGIDVPGDDKPVKDRVISAVIRTVGGELARDKAVEHEIFGASSLAWTLVRPPRLVDGPSTGKVGHDAHRPGRSSIRRSDLAALMVEFLEQERYVGQAPFVWNA